MKKLTIVLLVILHHPATAQIGVNTPNPKAMFHLDGKKNNETSGNVSPANQADDVVMTDNGFVGIGNNNPATSLDIKTTGTSAACTRNKNSRRSTKRKLCINI
jgi:hypothetical protein